MLEFFIYQTWVTYYKWLSDPTKKMQARAMPLNKSNNIVIMNLLLSFFYKIMPKD